jgi:hypothetical protein
MIDEQARAALGLGWAESLGRELARESTDHAALRRAGKAPLRRSWSQDFAAGVRGGERGLAAQRVNRALGEVPEAFDGDALEP